ncbi:ABC transporter substrate-binding protein [Pseudonocardia oroxyli]|uniref:Amino acid/amide ABC transporter substrate-binding protein, HAAT family n=1 Tax=Pseudonocardia oroxyli TaxID=366584 RepID=A0A1G7FNI1_PSEOR|nr:ABC transporter substrate-binding protein [Pseudonocardia oroxyli]SDE77481.1 amino acid/amide ABC transporter substrate-binding protein, HAAT family [Pseudonocardia oroxyli]
MMIKNWGRAAVVGVSALLLVACGSTADSGSSGSSGGTGGVKTDFGVTDSTITLGVMGDRTGVFKNLGEALIGGNELWVADVNAAGGICGRQLALEIVDHGYKADTAKTLYPQLEPKILGIVQLLGSPVLAALKQNLIDDNVSAAPASWSSEILNNPNIMMIGTTYDVEIIDGLSYLQQQGLIKQGDKIGHIYIDGEYGGNGLRGSKFYAEKHGMTVVESKITSTDNDLANIVTGLKGEGVTAIVLTTTPGQTASAMANNAALGLNVPVLGNNPTFDPALLSSPAAGALDKLYVAASSAPFSSKTPKAVEVATEYKAKYPNSPKNAGAQAGYVEGLVWQAVLEKACQNGDLSRAGVQTALKSLTSVGTDDLVAPLDYSSPGAPPTRGVYIAKVDQNAEGGLTEVAPLFTAPDASEYKAPHQQP